MSSGGSTSSAGRSFPAVGRTTWDPCAKNTRAEESPRRGREDGAREIRAAYASRRLFSSLLIPGSCFFFCFSKSALFCAPQPGQTHVPRRSDGSEKVQWVFACNVTIHNCNERFSDLIKKTLVPIIVSSRITLFDYFL